ncbi:MAG TPA: hypothetical protein VJB14_13705 [Planctomycetota bacterium]|nr:hypothetical protein [Planctomycetota bacterium]
MCDSVPHARLSTIVLAGLLLGGCGPSPAKGIASALIDEGVNPFTPAAGYVLDGESAGHLDEKTRLFTREAHQKIRRVDDSDPDPAQAVQAIDGWIVARVTVRSQATEPSVLPEIRKTFRYEAAKTVGTLKYSLIPSKTGRTLFLDLEIEERLR